MAEKDSKKSKKKKPKGGIRIAIWIAAALGLLIFFLVNQGRIFSNLKSTGFFDKTIGKTPSFVEKAEVKDENKKDKNEVQPMSPVNINITGNSEEETEERESIVLQNDAAKRQQQQILEEAKEKEEAEKIAKAAKEAEAKKTSATETKPATVTENKPKTVPQTMNIKLYFIVISPNGVFTCKEVTRSMKKSDSPLVDSIKALIAGPDVKEAAMDCKTMFNPATKLIGASVKNGVATLNFSDEFEFNGKGVEGLQGQLQQVVYTATAFPTVNSVQFLIDGEKREFLAEGIWIGTPLNRNSF